MLTSGFISEISFKGEETMKRRWKCESYQFLVVFLTTILKFLFALVRFFTEIENHYLTLPLIV